MTGANQKQVVTLEISSEVQLSEELLPDKALSNPREPCPVVTVVSGLTQERSCWKCETSDGRELKLDFYGCETPIECNAEYRRRNRASDDLYYLLQKVGIRKLENCYRVLRFRGR